MTPIRNWIEQAAARYGEARYLEDAAGTGTLTYAGLQRSAQAWAGRLDRAGLLPGARIAVSLADPLGYATALVSILAAGRVVVPLDPAAPAAQTSRLLAVARPEAAVSGADAGTPGLALLGRRSTDAGPADAGPADAGPADAGPADAGPADAGPADAGPADAGPADAGPADAGPADAGPAGAGPGLGGGIYLCTSGTTGTPKGILLSEDQLSHVAAAVAAHHRLGPADRGFCCLPLFHVNAEVVGLLATLAAGACLVLDSRFSRRGFWPLIEQRQVTWINAVPAIITVLAMDPPVGRPAGPGRRIRFIRSASAPLPPSALRRFEEAFGIPVVETYGMTEAASMITANPLDGPRKAGSVGLPAGAEVRVAELAAGRCAPGPMPVVGRVQIRGPGVITRYADGAPAGAFGPDGWLDTGDLGYFDEDGYLFLAGRSDDVINRGGEKIYPREIEDVLLAQPGVRSAAVAGVRDEVLGERPVAYVVPAGPWPAGPLEEAMLEEALREGCRAALPRSKQPSVFRLVPELPVGPTGKVARRQLRELALASRPIVECSFGHGVECPGERERAGIPA